MQFRSRTRDAIKVMGLRNLRDRPVRVVAKEIPKLGTGKVNHQELQAMVQSLKPQ